MRWLAVGLLSWMFSNIMSSHAQADILDNTLQTVSEGLDLFIPGDFDMRDVRVRVGVGVGLSPDFVGSDNYDARIIPVVDLAYKDRFRLFGTQATLKLFEYKALRGGLLLRYRSGRGEKDSSDLVGLGSVGGGFEAGSYLETRFNKTLIRARFSQDISGEHDGFTVFLTGDQGLYLSEDKKFAVGAGVRATWTSQDYNQAFFGISNVQSQNSGLSLYDIGSGFRDVTVRSLVRYDVSKTWRLSGLLQLGRLVGDVKDSPLVQERGSATQWLGGVGLSYKF